MPVVDLQTTTKRPFGERKNSVLALLQHGESTHKFVPMSHKNQSRSLLDRAEKSRKTSYVAFGRSAAFAGDFALIEALAEGRAPSSREATNTPDAPLSARGAFRRPGARRRPPRVCVRDPLGRQALGPGSGIGAPAPRTHGEGHREPDRGPPRPPPSHPAAGARRNVPVLRLGEGLRPRAPVPPVQRTALGAQIGGAR
jgi:hypothetical protein